MGTDFITRNMEHIARNTKHVARSELWVWVNMQWVELHMEDLLLTNVLRAIILSRHSQDQNISYHTAGVTNASSSISKVLAANKRTCVRYSIHVCTSKSYVTIHISLSTPCLPAGW